VLAHATDVALAIGSYVPKHVDADAEPEPLQHYADAAVGQEQQLQQHDYADVSASLSSQLYDAWPDDQTTYCASRAAHDVSASAEDSPKKVLAPFLITPSLF